MIEKLTLGWNRFGILGSQIALIAMLFFYGLTSLSDRALFPFVVSLLFAYAHYQWVQSSLYPLIDHATHHGNFNVLARLAWLHQDFVVLGSAVLIGLWGLFLWWMDSLDLLALGAVIIGLAGVNGSWKATLRYHASSVVIQAVAIRRLVLIVGGGVGFLVQDEAWVATFLFGVVIAALSLSAVRLLVGHMQRYHEHRYRRRYEDSGNKESYVSLAVRMSKAYLRSSLSLWLPVVIVLSTALMYRLVASISLIVEGPTTFVALGLMLVANQQVASLRPANQDWQDAWSSQRVSLLRDQLALIIERLLFRSSVMAVVIVAVVIAWLPTLEVWWLGAIFALVVLGLMMLQVYLLERQVVYLMNPLSSGWLHGFAALIFLSNGLVLSIYYPTAALYIGLGLLFGWWYLATLVEWTRSVGFEWRVHLRQSLKITSGFLLAMAANGLILFVLRRVPLGMDPALEGIVFAALFVMITSVIVYSMSAILGLHAVTRSVRVFIQETKESLLAYEEEVSLW